MINSIVLVGRLTKDPEIRYTPSGVPSCRFTIAVNRPFSNQSGEREADFPQCIAWRNQAENLANFMRKGSLIGVTGRIQTGSFEGQDGKRVYTTDVVADSIQFLEPRAAGQENRGTDYPTHNNPPAQTNSGNQGNRTPDADPFQQPNGPIEVKDDDLPF